MTELIWVLNIENKYGNSIYAARTEETLNDILINYVNEWWEEELSDEEMPSDPDVAISIYFDTVPYEFCVIDQIVLED